MELYLLRGGSPQGGRLRATNEGGSYPPWLVDGGVPPFLILDVPRLALLMLRSSRVFVAERRLDSTTLRRAIDPNMSSPSLAKNSCF